MAQHKINTWTPAADSRTLLPHLPSSSRLTPDAATGHSHPPSQKSGLSLSLLQSAKTNHPGVVISKLEDIFEAMADCILNEEKELSIQLKRKAKKSDRDENKSVDEPVPRGNQVQERFMNVTFPSKSPHEAWKFS